MLAAQHIVRTYDEHLSPKKLWKVRRTRCPCQPRTVPCRALPYTAPGGREHAKGGLSRLGPAVCIAYAPPRGVARATCRIARSSEYRPEAGVPRLASTQPGEYPGGPNRAQRCVFVWPPPTLRLRLRGNLWGRPSVRSARFALLCVCLSG